MKTRSILAVLAATLVISGCGNDTKTIGNNNNNNNNNNDTNVETNAGDTEATNEAFVPSGYYITVDGFKLAVDDKMDNVLATMGEAESYFEAPACAFDGIEKTYTYCGGALEIRTYLGSDKSDYVNYVVLKNDLVKTDEGLSIGDDVSKVVEVYGDGYKDNNGSYEYTNGNMKLLIVLENNAVVSIQYVSTVLSN